MQGQSILYTVISVVVSSKFSIIKVVTKPEHKMKEEEEVRRCLLRPHPLTNQTKGVIRHQVKAVYMSVVSVDLV